MERIINEIHEEDSSPKVEVDVKSDEISTEQCVEDFSEDEDEEENVEESQKPSPDVEVGDYVVIDRVREYNENRYRFSFLSDMVGQYGNKVLVVADNQFDKEGGDYVEDDCHQYALVDLYGRKIEYSWASSMFTRISPGNVRQRTLEGFSRELLAFYHLLENYLTSPLKVGVYQSDKIYSIIFDNDNIWKIESDCKGAIFNFPSESKAIIFYKNNFRDFQVAGELF